MISTFELWHSFESPFRATCGDVKHGLGLDGKLTMIYKLTMITIIIYEPAFVSGISEVVVGRRTPHLSHPWKKHTPDARPCCTRCCEYESPELRESFKLHFFTHT